MITGLYSKAESQLCDSLDLLITVEALQILISFSTREVSTHIETGKHNSELSRVRRVNTKNKTLSSAPSLLMAHENWVKVMDKTHNSVLRKISSGQMKQPYSCILSKFEQEG